MECFVVRKYSVMWLLLTEIEAFAFERIRVKRLGCRRTRGELSQHHPGSIAIVRPVR